MNEIFTTRARRLSAVAAKARARGLGWLSSRLIREIRDPETGVGKKLRRLIGPAFGAMATSGLLLPLFVFRAAGSGRSTLFLFYDLDVAPVTFNAVDHLVYAEIVRRRNGLKRVHIVLVPGKQAGLRAETPDYDSAVDRDSRLWRVHALLVPLATLLPSCAGVTICPNRVQAGILRLLAVGRTVPDGYWPALPNLLWPHHVFDAARRGERVFPALSSPPQALKFVQQWLTARASGRRVVVISLREYGFVPERNSNRAAWIAFARALDPAKYLAVFVHDTEVAMERSPAAAEGLCVFEPGPWNLALRSALYELAWLNVARQHGPMELCWYNMRSRYLLFMPVGVSADTTESYIREVGFIPGENLPFAARFQRFVWAPDTLEIIATEFERLAAELERAEREGEAEPQGTQHAR